MSIKKWSRSNKKCHWLRKGFLSCMSPQPSSLDIANCSCPVILLVKLNFPQGAGSPHKRSPRLRTLNAEGGCRGHVPEVATSTSSKTHRTTQLQKSAGLTSLCACGCNSVPRKKSSVDCPRSHRDNQPTQLVALTTSHAIGSACPPPQICT